MVTGNTAIDALQTTVREDYSDEILQWAKGSRLIVLTAHRRENLGEPMHRMFRAIRRIVERRPEIIDGSIGIARQLERRLEEQRLLNPGDVSGKVEFQNSLDEPEILGLMQALFHYEDEAP